MGTESFEKASKMFSAGLHSQTIGPEELDCHPFRVDSRNQSKPWRIVVERLVAAQPVRVDAAVVLITRGNNAIELLTVS